MKSLAGQYRAAAPKALALAAAYFLTARLGLSLGAVSGVATAVWPPAGISLAALLVFGNDLWPGIACGAFLANYSVGEPFACAVGIAAGNTLEALAGASVLQQLGFHNSLDRLRDVLGLVLLGGLLSTVVSATVGVTSAWLTGVVPPTNYGTAWWTWWLGDAMGDLVVAPALLIWSDQSIRSRSPRRFIEAFGLMMLVAVTSLTVFFLGNVIGSGQYPGAYIIFPAVVWAALRFDQRGTTLAILVTSGIAVWGTAQGLGPFVQATTAESLVALQVFMGVVALTGLVLGAVVTEGKRAETALRQSEAHYRSLIENGLDLISVMGADGVFRYASPSNVRVLGYTPEDLIGKSAFEFVHPDDAAEIQRAFATGVRRAGAIPSVQFRFRHHDGSWRFIEAIGNNLLDESGEAAVVINSRDITDRKLAEEALQEEAEVSQALAYVGRELISSLDRPALLDRLCQLSVDVLHCDCSHTLLLEPEEDVYIPVSGFGYPPELWEGLRTLKIPRAVMADQMAALERQEVRQLDLGEFSGPSVPGLARQVGITGAMGMALRRGGAMIGVHSVCYLGREGHFTPQQERIARGIAHLASLALENARLVEELARASRVKSDFVATMSHELRTPLNVIIGYNDLVLDGSLGPLTSEQHDSLQRVHHRARELLALINTTLDLSRLETGRLPIEVSEIAVKELIDELDVETREARQQNPQLSIEWKVANELLPLRTDVVKLKIVIKNLMANAIKFTPAGRLTVAVQQRDGGTEFCVADTGIGIPPEAQAVIFEAFRQADASVGHRYGGVGLGLYIVHRLVDLLGGTISVDSEVGRGSTFRAWVPNRTAP